MGGTRAKKQRLNASTKNVSTNAKSDPPVGGKNPTNRANAGNANINVASGGKPAVDGAKKPEMACTSINAANHNTNDGNIYCATPQKWLSLGTPW
jgi:hypothetical protein